MARREYTIGTRVKPTRYAISQFPRLKGKLGTVAGYGNMPEGRRIKWDHLRKVERYHRIFFAKAAS